LNDPYSGDPAAIKEIPIRRPEFRSGGYDQDFGSSLPQYRNVITIHRPNRYAVYSLVVRHRVRFQNDNRIGIDPAPAANENRQFSGFAAAQNGRPPGSPVQGKPGRKCSHQQANAGTETQREHSARQKGGAGRFALAQKPENNYEEPAPGRDTF